MSNKHLTTPPTDIAIAKLKVLLENVNDSYRTNTMVMETDIVSLYHEAINLFFESLDGSIIGAVKQIYPGAPSDPDSYNIFTIAIQKDLEALFAEIASLDKLVSSGFNSVIAEKDRILFKNKSISNKIGDYLLYADSTLGGGFFFGDSFNIAERIDSGSVLLEGSECFVDFDEGVVLLPLDGDPQTAVIKSVTVNKRSNGTSGNNHEVDVAPHNQIDTITDSEPNTWFEYEKVTVTEITTPLILDITIEIESSIINHININPINFGTRTPVDIKIIETSKDGEEYVSIKDEVPVKDFTSEQEENVFMLSSSTSKASGQGFYSFLPRRTQFLHLVFEQHTPYLIDTTNGERLRYAIGLRDINIFGRKFKTEGSLISTKFSAPEEIKKLSMWASENPRDASNLADIRHFVSHDDGASWAAVQPQGRDAVGIPEIINYNNNDPNSMTTSSIVETLRHKIAMTRDKDAFTGNAVLKEERITKADLLPLPVGSSTKVTLSDKPIKQTVTAILPFYGSFGCPRPRQGEEIQDQSVATDLDSIEFSVDVPAIDTLRFRLPYRNIAFLDSKIRVFVNGSQIEYSAKDSVSLNALTEDDKVYFLNRKGIELQFGANDSGGERKGFLPAAGSKIQVFLDGDNPYFTITDLGYVLNLSMPSDNDKEKVEIISLKQFDNTGAKEYKIDIPSGSKAYKKPLPLFGSEIGGTPPLPTFESEIAGTPLDIRMTTAFGRGESFSTPLSDEAKEGLLPPVFLSGVENFEIKEYYLNGSLIPEGEEQQFPLNKKVPYVDGKTELLDPKSYTFNHVTGTVFLKTEAYSDRRVVLVCKKLDVTLIDKNMWSFYRDPVNGRLDTQRILLDPKVVFTQKYGVDCTPVTPTKSVTIFSNLEEHSWFNKKIIKGSVVLSGLFSSDAKPVEVAFIDGTSEFANTFNIYEEDMELVLNSGNYRYTLKGISEENTLLEPLAFNIVRQPHQSTLPPVGFVARKDNEASFTTEGDWTLIENLDGTVTVVLKSSTAPANHAVSYSFSIAETGVDFDSLYSIDYFNNIVYFAKPIESNGSIDCEVSLYSAFYNIAESVLQQNIDSVDEPSNEVTFKDSFAAGFLKQDVSTKSRPQMIKLLYETYKKSTESLKDLEPYFSPICKDVAFKAVTVGTLNEI